MLYIDDIVFNQKQLDNAIENGHKNICLCDNSFYLSSADGISYMGIGDVKAIIRLDRERRYNISFENFDPVIIYTGGYTGITEKIPTDVIIPQQFYSSYGSYGSYGSYIGSYFSSYGSAVGAGLGIGVGLGVGLGSYGMFSSYFTSGSANTSFTSSYKASYTFSGSAQFVLCAPYTTEYESADESDVQAEKMSPVFYAAGYGLDLI